MPKIRVEYEVPEGDCWKCKESKIGATGHLCCGLFNRSLNNTGELGKPQRCQACIDAEVKEGE